MTKEELLEGVDKHYEEFLNNFEKEKNELIAILSPTAAKAATLFEAKSKEDWLKGELEKFN